MRQGATPVCAQLALHQCGSAVLAIGRAALAAGVADERAHETLHALMEDADRIDPPPYCAKRRPMRKARDFRRLEG